MGGAASLLAAARRTPFHFAVTDRIEAATSGRARCRSCGENIGKGEKRFGESIPNAYAEGEAVVWFHLACGACVRGEKFAPLLANHPDLPERDFLESQAALTAAFPRSARLLRAERASSGRARCRSCKEVIDKGRFRLCLGIFEEGRMEPIGFIHVACSLPYFGTAALEARIQRLSPGLAAADLEEIARDLAAVPATAPGAEGPGVAKTGSSAEPRARASSDD